MLQFHSSRHSTLRWLCSGVVFTAAWLVATLARADYLWIQPEANGAKIFAGELRSPLERLPVLLDAKVVLPEAGNVPYEPASDHFGVPKATRDITSEGWRSTLIPAKDGSATLSAKNYFDVRHTATLSFEVSR